MAPVPTALERSARYDPLLGYLLMRLLQPRVVPDTADVVPTFSGLAVECKLARERRRRSSKCSACRFGEPELEIDHAIAQLISNGSLVSSKQCPYLAFTSALVVGVMSGPEAELSGWQGQLTRIRELETALSHIARALHTMPQSRDEILDRAEEDDPYFTALAKVIEAEALISHAWDFLKQKYKSETGGIEPFSSRGRPRALDLQGIVIACADEWERLMGKQPGKNNVSFHDLLQAASATVFGPRETEPDWGWAIREAKRRKQPGRKVAKETTYADVWERLMGTGKNDVSLYDILRGYGRFAKGSGANRPGGK
jgi:hypothetical protein